MYSTLRPWLFRLDPEQAHQLTLTLLRLSGALPPVNWLIAKLFQAPARPVTAFGLTFKNPVGLAAGYDKDGLAIRGLSALGFGHIEIGTVTPLPQPGNERPRLFRLVEDEAIINRMGFPSRGAEFVQMRLNPGLQTGWLEKISGQPRRRRPPRRPWAAILGVNLGKNKNTPNEEAVFDYLSLIQNFAPYADYLTINVSSPNTPGLRALQGGPALEALLSELHRQRRMEEARLQKRLPLLVKLSPDLSASELDEALEVILTSGMDGVIATNTTLARPGLRSAWGGEAGGLSGSPLRVQSEAALRQIVKRVEGRIPIISVGGIMSASDARRRLEMGATLVQIFTGLVYRGPGLVREIVSGL